MPRLPASFRLQCGRECPCATGSERTTCRTSGSEPAYIRPGVATRLPLRYVRAIGEILSGSPEISDGRTTTARHLAASPERLNRTE